LALAADGHEHGAIVMQSPATSALNDNWSLVPTSDGYYHVLAQHTGFAMLALGSKNGAKIVQGLLSQNMNDDWCFISAGNNLYEVRNRSGGKSLSFSNTGVLQLWTYWGTNDQKFSVVVAGSLVPTLPLRTPAWYLPVETTVLPVAAANLADGRILMWSSISRNYFGLSPSNATWTAIYNPSTGGWVPEKTRRTHLTLFVLL
jgi:hypothetical protein